MEKLYGPAIYSDDRKLALTLSGYPVFGAALSARHGGGCVQSPKVGLCSSDGRYDGDR